MTACMSAASHHHIGMVVASTDVLHVVAGGNSITNMSRKEKKS